MGAKGVQKMLANAGVTGGKKKGKGGKDKNKGGGDKTTNGEEAKQATTCCISFSMVQL